MLAKPSRRSSFSAMLIASAVVAVCAGSPSSVRSADVPAVPEVPAAPATAAESSLPKLADDFLHYSQVGNLELAHDNAQAIIDQKAEPKAVMEAFEKIADGRNIRAIIERNQRRPELKEVSGQLMDIIESGYRTVARDPARIKADIERLASSPRAYQNAKEHLTSAGEFAVPYYIQYLQDSNNKNLHPYIVRVMTEIGRPLLPALVQQLQTPNESDKLTLITVMGNIGYGLAVPYLKAVAQDDKVLAEVRSAAQAALVKINERTAMGKGSAADSFQVLAENYYNSRPAVGPQNAKEGTNPVWYYDRSLNDIRGVQVPTSIWNDVQAMRAAEMALKLEANKPASISIWVAADLRRELHLAAGQTDPTREANAPDAMFYALAAGPLYLNPALSTSLSDRDSALTLKLLAALEATGGTQGTVATAGDAGNPLVRALGYPDRAVRFNAAFALGRADPAKDFAGSYRVVPILCEAISQSNAPHIVLVNPSEANRASMRSMLTGLNYVVHEGATLTAAMSDAAPAAAFDAVIVPGSEALHVAELAATDYRLSSTPVIVTTPDAARVDALQAEVDHIGPLYKAQVDTLDAPSFQAALGDLKKVIAVTPIDDAAAGQFALTSISIIDTLATDRQSIYKVSDAVPTLTEALKDKRIDVAVAAAGALGKINNNGAQKAISEQIFAENVDPKLKVALLNGLASSAKITGNHVAPAIIDQLIELVTKDGDAELRSAGAKALGALNVQSGQSAQLILNQAK